MFEVRFPDETEQLKLRIGKNGLVYDIIKLSILNSTPLMLEYTIMPIYVNPGINENILKSSIYSHNTDPVLEVEQVVYLDDGIPFEYSQTRHRYDKGDFTATNLEHRLM